MSVQVEAVSLKNFGPYDEVQLQLPKKGITLLTGENGSGKTTFVQAVSHALWDRPVVGDPMWRDKDDLPEGGVSRVSVQLGSGMEATRVRSRRGTKTLNWGTDAEGDTFPTTTKAQESLESVVGPGTLWRWSSVFVSDAPDVFTRATDKQRKQMLEELLELDRFESALKNTRTRLRTERDKAANLAAEVDRLRHGAEQAQQALSAGEPPTPITAIEDLRRNLDEAKEASRQATMDHDDTAAEFVAAAYTPTQLDHEVAEWRSALNGADTCSFCGQTIDKSDAEARREWVEEHEASRREREHAAAQQQAKISTVLGKLSTASSACVSAVWVAESAISEHNNKLAAYAAWRNNTESARNKVLADRMRADDLDIERVDVDQRIALLEAADHVFGLKGVRARITGQVLKSIEAGSNLWLRRLGGQGWGVQLRAHGELKSGKVSDRIALKVMAPADHTSGWREYWGTSTGQRRRFDLAVMLAIADVLRGLRGDSWSTMFFDEPFHGIDEDGRVKAIQVIREIAEHTNVVVVCHDANFIDRLRPVQHVHIEEGRLV